MVLLVSLAIDSTVIDIRSLTQPEPQILIDPLPSLHLPIDTEAVGKKMNNG